MFGVLGFIPHYYTLMVLFIFSEEPGVYQPGLLTFFKGSPLSFNKDF